MNDPEYPGQIFYYFLIKVNWQMYFLSFKDLFKLNLVGIVNKGDFLNSKAFKYVRYKKVFLDENTKKKGFQTWKTPKSQII